MQGRNMEISTRRSLKRSQEPVDEWLQNEGYYRKHAPRDPTCLFRAVAEQVYLTQHYHIRVRRECVEFMRKMKHLFKECTTIPFESYLEQMACFTEWGGMNEIQAMSLLYKREVIIFNGQKQTRRVVTNNGFEDTLYLCYTSQKQYETVYTRNFISTAAYCQSIVYGILYKDVFDMPNIQSTVHKMLHDKNTVLRHDKFFLKGNLEIRDQLTTEVYNRLENVHDEDNESQSAASKGLLPVTYRVAKALDPDIYRNTDFDIWHEIRREVKNAGWNKHSSNELQVGGKCLIEIHVNCNKYDRVNNNTIYTSAVIEDFNGNKTRTELQELKQDPVIYCGYIQEMTKNEGPVLVFIEELGEKRTVPYSALKPFPVRKNKQSNWSQIGRKNVPFDSNQKWRKVCGGPRKTKDTIFSIDGSNNNDRRNNNNISGINDTVKANFDDESWYKPPLNDQQRVFENYETGRCSNYTLNESNNNPEAGVTQIRQHDIKEDREDVSMIPKDNNSLPIIPYVPGEGVSNENERSLRSINCAVQKSIDVNGSDLPLSDLLTLRFFYNLGLEYFHITHTWQLNGQPSTVGPWYQGMLQSGQNEIVNIDNTGSETDGRSMSNNFESVQCDKAESRKSESDKESPYIQREKRKDQIVNNKDVPRTNRNGVAPRFKKTSNDRQRNGCRQNNFPQQVTVYQNGRNEPVNSNSKNEFAQGPLANPSLQACPSFGTANTPNSYYGPYVPQSMYPNIPVYTNEAEPFGNPYYVPNTGFLPVPYVSHPDVTENNNFHPYLPHICPATDNYAQAYPAICTPYLYPQQATYPTVPPQNASPEHWYASPGQPQYVQYNTPPGVIETVCNTSGHNMSLNGSP